MCELFAMASRQPATVGPVRSVRKNDPELLGAFANNPLFVANRVLDLRLNSPVECLAHALGNVGRGSHQVLGETQIGQGSLGLTRCHHAARRREPDSGFRPAN